MTVNNKEYENNQTVYTKNKDGTVEKWYYVGKETDGRLCLRKGDKNRHKYRDYLKSFNENEVFKTRSCKLCTNTKI